MLEVPVDGVGAGVMTGSDEAVPLGQDRVDDLRGGGTGVASGAT